MGEEDMAISTTLQNIMQRWCARPAACVISILPEVTQSKSGTAKGFRSQTGKAFLRVSAEMVLRSMPVCMNFSVFMQTGLSWPVGGEGDAILKLFRMELKFLYRSENDMPERCRSDLNDYAGSTELPGSRGDSQMCLNDPMGKDFLPHLLFQKTRL